MLTKTYAEIIECIKSDMSKFDSSLRDSVKKYGNELTKDLESFLSQGSKRLRIVFIFLITRALGYEPSQKQFNLANGIELMHNASLLHDDVVDNATVRRKKKSFNAIYDNTISIIGGDYLLSLALENFMSIKEPKILKLFLKTLKTLCEGEIHQYFYKNNICTIDEYIEKSYKKTAVLYEFAVLSAAFLTDKTVDFSEFIRNYGIAFQIRDDYNNIYKAETSTDIEEGVFTAPVISAAADYEQIDDFEPRKIFEIIKNKKYEQLTKELLQKYINKSIESLNFLKDSEYKAALIELCRFLEV